MEKLRALTLPEIREVYFSQIKRDFGRSELKPFSVISSAYEDGCYRCYGLWNGEKLLAYAFFQMDAAEEGQKYLLDYLAVSKELRGTGIGSRFLRRLREECLSGADCVLLEVEDPACAARPKDREDRERRLRFYCQNGLRDTGVRSRTFEVDYLILELPAKGVHTREETLKLYRGLYRRRLPEGLFRRWIQPR